MTPPPIRKPTRSKHQAVGSANAVPDRNKFINVSEVLQTAIQTHNSASKILDRPENCYIEFPYEASSRERNRKALKVVEQHLERVLSFEENGEEKSYYGTYTFSELSPKLREAAVQAVTEDPDMKVFTQGENNWMVKTLIDQKMASKLRTIRGRAKRSEQALKQVPNYGCQDQEDEREELQPNPVGHYASAPNILRSDAQERISMRDYDDNWESDRLVEANRRSEEEAANKAQKAYEAASNATRDMYPLEADKQIENAHDIDKGSQMPATSAPAHHQGFKPNQSSMHTQQELIRSNGGKQGNMYQNESVFDLPRVSSRGTAAPVLSASEPEEHLSSIDAQIATLMKRREQAVANITPTTKNTNKLAAKVPTSRSRLQTRQAEPSISANAVLESKALTKSVAQKRNREVSHGRGRNVRGKKR